MELEQFLQDLDKLFIDEIGKSLNQLLLDETGKKLDHVQEAILYGTSQGKTYQEIAEEKGFQSTKNNARVVGAHLWETISRGLGSHKKFNKAKFRALIEDRNSQSLKIIGDNKVEKLNFHSPSAIAGETVTVNNFNLCHQTKNRSPSSTPQSPHQTILEIAQAPPIAPFYGRHQELANLEKSVLELNPRLISILGIIGIGKTSLICTFIEQIKPHFDYIIYRSIKSNQSLHTLATDLISIFSVSPETQSNQNLLTPHSILLENLHKYRCLLIFDDWQHLYSSNKQAGKYQTGYENYGDFIKDTTLLNHQSCLVIVSREEPKELATLKAKNAPIFALHLQGLGEDARSILDEKKLPQPENWSKLIEMYQGHPWLLKMAIETIQKYTNLTDFLAEATLFLGDFEEILDHELQRLSANEIQLISILAKVENPLDTNQIKQALKLSLSDTIKLLQSLDRRLFLETVEQANQNIFALHFIISSYLKRREFDESA